jgi:flagellar motor switch protein FliG
MESLEHFPREVEPGKARPFALNEADDSEALLIVLKAAVSSHAFVERILSGMSKRRVSQVVREGNAFREILI